MKRIRFNKKYISIARIGKQRFWFGLLVGLFTAILISLLINYVREAFRVMTSIMADLLVLDDKSLVFYNYFFAGLASILGFSVTNAIWMTNRKHTKRMDKLFKQQSQAISIFVFWTILLVLTQFGTAIGIANGQQGYDNHLDIFADYWFYLLLIPFFIFIQTWLIARRVYRVKKWMLISFVSCIIMTFILANTTTVNQDKINDLYYKQYEQEYAYLDSEISKAKENYGITFDAKTIKTLKKWRTIHAINQVSSIKEVFKKGKPISLDTIILQKIIIHNFKGNRFNKRKWRYVFPKDVLKQIQFHNVNSNETKELFLILKEEIDLINTPNIDLSFSKTFTRTEKQKSYYAHYGSRRKVTIAQLTTVRDSLMKIDQYKKLNVLLPEIVKQIEID